MEGGSKSSLNLEAGLDITTSDMLIPIASPTFQHNWQKYQGKFLPNSLRFEKNGWAAGWNVYNFEYKVERVPQNGYYLSTGKLNQYVKTLNVYEDEIAYNPLHTVYIVPESVSLSAGLTIEGNTISGKVGETPFSLNWDPVAHTLTCDDPTIELTYDISFGNVTFAVKKVNGPDVFNYSFKLSLPTALSGDSLENIAYTGFEDDKYIWGDFTYDISANVLTTPEGVELTPVVQDNEVSFDYTKEITDETLDFNIVLSSFYVGFSDITCQDAIYQDNFKLGGSDQLPFNKYKATVSPTRLRAKDTNGIVLDWQLPLWATMTIGAVRPEASAKICNNVDNYEVAVMSGTGIRMSGTVNNAFDGTNTFSVDEEYRASKPKYIKGLKYRFNQLLLSNTIALSSNWDPRKYLLSDEVWYLNSRQYANLRNKDITLLEKLLGSVYNWGEFCFKPDTVFEYNNPYNMANKDSCIYTMEDLSDILSFKLKGDSDSITEGDDRAFINSHMTSLDMSIIASVKESVVEYRSSDLDKTITELYDDTGKYIGGTYETVPLDSIDFWPFTKVPKFNINGIKGVYWTDGTTYITNLDDFKAKVLGERDSSIETKNSVIILNGDYNRTRVVNRYKPCYDFNFIKQSDYTSLESYTAAKNAWNLTWQEYYPNTSSPLDQFNDDIENTDRTYLDFNDIEVISNVDPVIKFVSPGVYAFGKKAVPFNNAMGLILYNNDDVYNITAEVWHHAVKANSKYNLLAQHEKGVLKFGGSGINVPYYFGKNGSVILVSGYKGDTFNVDQSSATVTASKLTAGVNCNYVKLWYKSIEDEDEDTTVVSIRPGEAGYGVGTGYYVWTWLPSTVNDTCWLGNVLVSFTNEAVSVRIANLNSGVQAVRSYYVTGDISSGVKFAWPVWGHSQTRITYPNICNDQEILKDGVFTFEAVPTSQLTNTKYIYFDRSDTVKSLKLYDVVKKNISLYDGSDKVTLGVSLVAAEEGAFLFYAKPQYDTNRNEVIKNYYIPGIAWGSAASELGNLSQLTEYPTVNLKGVPSIKRFPTSVMETFSDKNTLNTLHKFYSQDKLNITGVLCELQDPDFSTLKQDILVNCPAGQVVLHYNSADESITCDDFDVFSSDSADVKGFAYRNTGNDIKIPISISLKFNNNKAKFLKLSDHTLLASDNSTCTIATENNKFVYDFNSHSVIEPSDNINVSVVGSNGVQDITIEGSPHAKYSAYLKAVYEGNIENGIVAFDWNDLTFTWELLKDTESSVSVLSTDIRSPDKTKEIGKIKTRGQYQLLKQQWNTTIEVENFWWLDEKHVLELNQTNFIVKRNTGKLDDWNGERFENVLEISRSDILSTDIRRYFVPNKFNTDRHNVFVTIQLDSGDMLFKFYDPRRSFELLGVHRTKIQLQDIGQKLNVTTRDGDTSIFNTYNPLTAEQVLSEANWSSSIVGDFLIIGCHLNNNFDQWAFVIDLTGMTLETVIQGYGYVGLHGELTGGQIPDDYFDTNCGFNSTVQPLSVLKSSEQLLDNLDAAYEVNDVSKVNNITAKVVGTSEQQWYIQKRLHGVVSHLAFNAGKFTKCLLPITNNYAAIYKSPSWASAVMGDGGVKATPFATMFQFDNALQVLWNLFMGFAGALNLYTIAPRYAQIAYLQQTFGQYAYVHYNSSKSLPEKEVENSKTDSGISNDKNKQTDAVLSSDFIFDKQKFSQNASTSLSYTNKIMAVLIGAFADSLQYLDKKPSINEEINETAIKDTGRRFIENVSVNTGDLLASAITTQSKSDSGLTSVVTGLKSLDMFYSTSDQQHVYAGPGFVEHQFVADCIAQSVTDTQLEGKTQQFFFCIRALTSLQSEISIMAKTAAADALDTAADATSNLMVCGTNVGAAIAVGMHAGAAVLRASVQVESIAIAEIEKVLDVICQKGMVVNTDEQVSRHALSIEGKHKYGEKNEVFMWPCFGVQSGKVKYTDEWVDCGVRDTPWSLTLNSIKAYSALFGNAANTIFTWEKPAYSSNKMGTSKEAAYNCGPNLAWTSKTGQENFDKPGDTYRAYYMSGRVPFYQASAFGKVEERVLPDDMACVEGVSRFLPNEPFKNENISVSEPAFAPSMQQDYIIDKQWDLAQYCTYGTRQWVAVKDTKVIDCPPSNMVVSDKFCGIACTYAAVEVKRGIEKAYMRPWAVTPNTLAFNCTGYNSILDNKLYHAFDGISYRLVSLIGSPGMNKNRQSFWYSFQINDRFKRSNKVPANELQGNFESEPVQAVDSIDKLYNLMTVASKEKGLEAGTIGEDKDLIRWAVPIFTEPVSTLPAAVKTMTAMTLGVVEGITSLCVDLANNQSAYKAPLSVDFTIGKNVYRATEEYICSVQTQNGIDIVTDLIPILGLKYIGATPTEAFFYSKSTRCYYSFSGSTLTKIDMIERFRDIQKGYWDFVNQEVVMPCLMTFKRLNPEVLDTDTETDNIIVPVLSKGTVSGELPPPITTIFNDRSWYKVVSLPSGLAYQGPNRVIINRNIFVEYMERSIKSNLNKWKKMDREKYVTKREYPEQYNNIMQDVTGVDGWTYNPFLLVTSPLGLNEDTDCIFEWTITFCWPIEMDLLYGTDNYAVVNITAETMTPGGKVKSRPTHVFLTKELFTRTGNYGYYSFRFQSKNGAGNRERLHIWSDQYIAISSIDCEYKQVTNRRTEQLTQQIDIQRLREL